MASVINLVGSTNNNSRNQTCDSPFSSQSFVVVGSGLGWGRWPYSGNAIRLDQSVRLNQPTPFKDFH